ncbi:terminase [Bacillus velezensis]|nr:terminase [Bacillus velezensis]MBL4961192.1 terminase [Bacillus velezensis]
MKNAKREQAFTIYQSHKGRITNRALAGKSGVSARTIGRWKKEGRWDEALHKNAESGGKNNPGEGDELNERQRLFCLYYVKSFNDTSLYDMMLKALKQTKSQTGRNYQLYSEKGRLGLREWPEPSDIWVLETGVNITGYQYSTSIDDTATRVVMRLQKDDKTVKASASDSAGMKTFGVLQYTETVSACFILPLLTVRERERLGMSLPSIIKIICSRTIWI